jgi:hypothetical protein
MLTMDIKFGEVGDTAEEPNEDLGRMEVKPLIGAPESMSPTHPILLRLEADIQAIAEKHKVAEPIKKNLIAHFKSLKAATKEE